MFACLLVLLPLFLIAQEPSPAERLFCDLEMVHSIDERICERLPLVVNYQLQGGYFAMPSARTFDAGTIGLGFANVPPYHIWSLGFQFFDHIETTGNYWVYKGMQDPVFGHLGFGDSAERSANIKVVLLRPEDGIPFLPDFALGFNDFLGTCRFHSFYAVATQEILPWNLEATLGWGNGRMQGFFGGLAWTPFRQIPYLKDLTFAAEYDANDYKRHIWEHPDGRRIKSRINAGIQWKFLDIFRFSASTIRGTDWATSLAAQYDLGSSNGLFPKIHDVPAYVEPVDTQPIGLLRTQQELAQDFAFALKEQGFDLYSLYLVPCENGQDHLYMKIVNVRYREEEDVRCRIEHVLASLTPSNIANIHAVIEADGVPVHEYRFRNEDLKRYAAQCLGEYEFRVISPLREATPRPGFYDSTLLYQRRKSIWLLTVRPWFRTFLGSRRGKFKYEAGIAVNPEGYLFDEVYYNLSGTYTAKSSAFDIDSSDILNPSKIINVRTDSILYNQSNSLHLDQAYIQKSWNMTHGWFSRLSLGYFEPAYAGVAMEALYYPVYANWAIGFETAALLKRSYYNLGFQRKIRKWTSKGAIFVPYTGFQYFIDFYYQYKPFNLDFKVSAGQFLARDKGIRIEGGRTFCSGLRVGLWYTLTNAGDTIGGKRYYDKGFSISLPLDLFLMKSSRTRLTYSMSAWLRDCGAVAATGKQLYNTLFWERFNSNNY